MAGRVLLVGLGDLGGWILELLARESAVSSVVVADKNEEWATKKIFNVVGGVSYKSLYPKIDFVRIDLNNEEETAEKLDKIGVDVIVNATTLQSWWVVGELPKDVWERLETGAGYGPWLPMHLTLTYKLMKALKMAGNQAPVVNCAFPDAVNPVLAKVGLGPTVGIGNSDLLIPGIKKTVAEKLCIPMNNVSVNLLAHHFHVVYFGITGNSGGFPYFLRLRVGDQDVTEKFDPEYLMRTASQLMPGGNHCHPMVAASAVKNVMAILRDTGELTHAPGPAGLPGGYDIRLSAKGAEVLPPAGMTLERSDSSKCPRPERRRYRNHCRRRHGYFYR
jgi:Saccharopine dehydrogenase.